MSKTNAAAVAHTLALKIKAETEVLEGLKTELRELAAREGLGLETTKVAWEVPGGEVSVTFVRDKLVLTNPKAIEAIRAQLPESLAAHLFVTKTVTELAPNVEQILAVCSAKDRATANKFLEYKATEARVAFK